MALSEYSRGVAVLNDSKYGHACDDNVMRLSLLRASKCPDSTADIGYHKVSIQIYCASFPDMVLF